MPDYVNHHLQVLTIMPYTVKICRQDLNTTKTAKDTPFFYKAEEPDFKEMTTDQLNHLYLEAQSIMARIQTMLESKG